MDEWEATPWDKLTDHINEILTEETQKLTKALVNDWSLTAFANGTLGYRMFIMEISIEDETTISGTCKEDDVSDTPKDLQHKFDTWKISGVIGADQLEITSEKSHNCFFRIKIPDPSVINESSGGWKVTGDGMVNQDTLGAIARFESLYCVDFTFKKKK